MESFWVPKDIEWYGFTSFTSASPYISMKLLDFLGAVEDEYQVGCP